MARGSSITASASPAASSAAVPADLVNVPAGYPAQERYPGAVGATEHLDPGPDNPARTGPVLGQQGSQPFRTVIPQMEPGGGVADMPWTHDGPELPWDSSSGEPFAPSGPVDPDVHGQDTGGVRRHEHVIPAAIGVLTRETGTGQTWHRVAATQSAIGQTAPNGRVNLDQQQWHNPDAREGFGPFPQPYSERPILNNLAYQPAPMDAIPSSYAPDGGLPDMSAYQSYPAIAYDQPADPAVGSASQVPQASAGIGGGWVLR